MNRKRLTEAEKIKDEQEDELIKLRTDGDVTRDELNRASAKAEELAIQVDQVCCPLLINTLDYCKIVRFRKKWAFV